MNTTVPFGPASLIGYGGALAAAIIAAVEALEANGQTPGSVKWLLIISAALAAFTNHGRQIQAAAQPAPVEVLTEKPETAVTPEAPPVA